MAVKEIVFFFLGGGFIGGAAVQAVQALDTGGESLPRRLYGSEKRRGYCCIGPT